MSKSFQKYHWSPSENLKKQHFAGMGPGTKSQLASI